MARRRRRRNASLFIGAFLFLVIVGHAYMMQRLVLDTSLDGAPRALAASLILLLGGSVLAQAFLSQSPARFRRVFGWVAYVWFGVAFLLVTVLLVSEIPFGVGRAVGEAALWSGDNQALSALLLWGGVVGWGVFRALGPAPVRRVEVRLDDWPKALDGYRIAQLSDLHLSTRRGARFAASVVRRANAIGADLVAVTGDVVDGSVAHLEEASAPLGDLRARHGVYLVTGNHDHYSGADAWCARFAALGIRPLRNERITVEELGHGFALAGVDDHRGDWQNGSTCDLPLALAGWDPETPLVLLAHNPETFDEASRAGVHLQLSGHTHGGQIWPFHGAVRATTPFVAGLYRRGRSTLYVSRGTGFWGPPLRVGAPPEITEIVLRSGGSGAWGDPE